MCEAASQIASGYIYALGFATGLITIYLTWMGISKSGPKAERKPKEYRKLHDSLAQDEDEILG